MSVNNFKYDDIFSQEDKEQMIKDYLENNLTIREVAKKYNIKSNSYIQKVLSGHTRNISQAGLIAHKKYPERYKHTDETKQKIREHRLRFMKEHPEETAWRKRNKPSYPEECFIKFLQERGYDKKYLIEREKSVFPYFIDFAFVDVKLAVEIDGSQHILDDVRKQRDIIKNKVLKTNGWKLLRVSEHIVKTDWDILDKKIKSLLDNNVVVYEQVGIVKAPKTHPKVERLESGLSKKQEEQHYNQRKVQNRPTKEELLKLIQNNSFSKIGRMFGVTDNTIRKWCRLYDLPFRKKDIEK